MKTDCVESPADETNWHDAHTRDAQPGKDRQGRPGIKGPMLGNTARGGVSPHVSHHIVRGASSVSSLSAIR
jgi:hypothetical protein